MLSRHLCNTESWRSRATETGRCLMLIVDILFRRNTTIISINWIISALRQFDYIPKTYGGFLILSLTCFAPWICTTILCKMRKQIDDNTVLISRKWLTSQNILWAKKDIGLSIPTDTRYIPGRVVILSSHWKNKRVYC